MKNCSICGLSKPEESYNKDRSRADGLQRFCKDCNRDRIARWYQENRAYKIAAVLAYRRGQTPPARRGPKRPRKPTPATPPEKRLEVLVMRLTEGEMQYLAEQSFAAGLQRPEDWLLRLLQREMLEGREEDAC